LQAVGEGVRRRPALLVRTAAARARRDPASTTSFLEGSQKWMICVPSPSSQPSKEPFMLALIRRFGVVIVVLRSVVELSYRLCPAGSSASAEGMGGILAGQKCGHDGSTRRNGRGDAGRHGP